jgi:hypothetical protein
MLYIYGVRAISRKAKAGQYSSLAAHKNPNSSSIQKTANALGAQISNTLPAIADEVRPAVLLQRDTDACFGSIASFERCRHVCFTPDSGRMTGTQRTDALLRSKMHLFDHLVSTHKD